MFSAVRHRLESLPEPAWLFALLLAWLSFVEGSLALCGPGFVHPESYSFLPHYLSGRPFFDLVTDNRVNDWGLYCAREFAFVFDYLDCHFIAWSWRRGHPHFFSATHYVFLLLAGLALWRMGTRHLALGRVLAFALVLLLWSGPSAMLYTSYYRTAKVGLLLATMLVAWTWFQARDPRLAGARAVWRVALFALCALAMPMFDKQGLIFLCALAAFLAQQAVARPSARARQLLAAGLLALAAAWGYQRYLGPWIIEQVHGYTIEREYASVPVARLLHEPRFLAKVMLGAPLLAVDSFRFPLGGLPLGHALIAGWWMQREIAAISACAPMDRSWRRWASHGWLVPALVALVCAVYAAMLMLFPLLLSNEHRRFYYPLPVTALWFLAAAAAMSVSLRRHLETKRWIELAVVALVAGNLFALPEHRFVLRHGHYASFCANAARLRSVLRPENIAAAGVPPERAAALLAEAPYYFDAVPPSLDKDRLFLHFLSQRKVVDSRPDAR